MLAKAIAFRKHDAPEEPVPPAPQSSTPMRFARGCYFQACPCAFIDLSDAPPCSFAAASDAAFQQDENLLPPVGETPDEVELEADSSGGTSNNSTCLIVSLQNLGLPVSCNFPWSVLSLLWGYSSPAFGDYSA